MPRIPTEFIEELLARTDILDLTSSYVRFAKRSGANHVALCPFHSEKTPSFSVSTEKQIYYCFGCQKGGNAIHFIREIENLQYTDAVEFLARRAGMTVPDGESAENAANRNRLLDLNRDAARFFHETLYSPQGEAAARYMRERGIAKRIATRFGLGAAPDAWNALTDAMTARGYTWDELIAAGLAKRGKNNGIYDVFRNRLVFPVIDVRGAVVGFSGRALGDAKPKYLNTSDTPVYNKRRTLFALNLAKKSKAGMLILVEGNIDVVSLHQAGIDCAVASLGTSLTQEQARLVKRYVHSAVIAYDGDAAGVGAAAKAAHIMENAGLSVRVMRMNGAKDPDEYIQKFGADAFRLLIEKSESFTEYRLNGISDGARFTTDEDRLRYIKDAVELLADLRGAAEREVYGRRAAQTAEVSYESIENEVRRAVRAREKREAKRERDAQHRPLAAMQPSDRSLRYEDEYSAAAEQGVIRSLFHDPELFAAARAAGLREDEFTSPLLGRIYALLLRRDGDGANISIPSVAAELEPNEASELTRILSAAFSPSDAGRAFSDYIAKIRTERAGKSDDINEALIAVQQNKKRKVLG